MTYTTKTTRLNDGYGCRVYRDGVLVVESKATSRALIGATYRDLLRTLDKGLGADAFTGAARDRKYKEGNLVASVRHAWA